MAVRMAALFEGFEKMNLPAATRFVVAYGSVAFPIFGIGAAAAFILSEVRGRNPWVQLALTAVFALLFIWAFSGLFSGGSFIGPTIQTYGLDSVHSARVLLPEC